MFVANTFDNDLTYIMEWMMILGYPTMAEKRRLTDHSYVGCCPENHSQYPVIARSSKPQ